MNDSMAHGSEFGVRVCLHQWPIGPQDEIDVAAVWSGWVFLGKGPHEGEAWHFDTAEQLR